MATPFLKMFGIVMGAYLLAKEAHAAESRLAKFEGDKTFLSAKIVTASFFAEQLLPEVIGLRVSILHGIATSSMSLTDEQFQM